MYAIDQMFDVSDTCPNHFDNQIVLVNSMFWLATISIATYGLIRFFESQNQLNYDSRAARVTAGFLLVLTRMLHTRDTDYQLEVTDKTIIAIGPHRTGWEALVVASKIKGNPPHFLATDSFNAIPGISALMKMFKVIPVKSKPITTEEGRPARGDALIKATEILNKNGCVAIFPQGKFARIGEDAPKVHIGTAKLAIANNTPIVVLRLDGFWSLQNPLIPKFLRNNMYYRAFGSYFFHMDNVKVSEVHRITYHLEEENIDLPEQDKINEICAQLHACFRHTEDLNDNQISKVITDEISSRRHFSIWKKNEEIVALEKELAIKKAERAKLEDVTDKGMEYYQYVR